MGTLTIVRHGNTFDKGETLLRVGGRTDLPLSKSGRKQALQLAEHFSERRFDLVLCSPLKRQQQTAEAILSHLATPDTLNIDSRLTEVDYGPDEGVPEVEVVARLGAEVLKRWEDHRTPPPDWHIDEVALSALWANLLVQACTQNVLVVTSNGTARYLFEHVARGDAPYKLRTGAYGTVSVSQDNKLTLENWDVRPS
jgi:probable phosphoglycerate mutase